MQAILTLCLIVTYHAYVRLIDIRSNKSPKANTISRGIMNTVFIKRTEVPVGFQIDASEGSDMSSDTGSVKLIFMTSNTNSGKYKVKTTNPGRTRTFIKIDAKDTR